MKPNKAQNGPRSSEPGKRSQNGCKRELAPRIHKTDQQQGPKVGSKFPQNGLGPSQRGNKKTKFATGQKLFIQSKSDIS